jgi:SAM-dependent methyltransferase
VNKETSKIGKGSQDLSRTSVQEPAESARGTWDLHWHSLGNGSSRSFFGLASSAVRRFIFQPAVQFFLDKYFPPDGVFVETGCGTGESSVKVPRRNRQFVGIDFSPIALEQAQSTGCFDSLLCADLFQLPLPQGSVDGIWNLGVMEHFQRIEILQALSEFRRILKPGGTIVLFWPAEGNLSRWALAPVEFLRSSITRQTFRFFPDEVSRMRSREEARATLSEAGFTVLEVDFSARTAFIHMVLVGRIPQTT